MTYFYVSYMDPENEDIQYEEIFSCFHSEAHAREFIESHNMKLVECKKVFGLHCEGFGQKHANRLRKRFLKSGKVRYV